MSDRSDHSKTAYGLRDAIFGLQPLLCDIRVINESSGTYCWVFDVYWVEMVGIVGEVEGNDPSEVEKVVEEGVESAEYTSTSESESDEEDSIDSEPELLREIAHTDQVNGQDLNQEEEQLNPEDCVEVDFEFFDTQESDYHAVKQFLLTVIDGADLNLIDLAETISNQSAVGTTVKADGSEDQALAFITALSYDKHRSKPCIKDWIAYVSKRCGQQNWKQFQSIIDSNKKVGLVFHERVVNFPLELVGAMYQSFLDDVTWAKTNAVRVIH